MYRLPGDRVPLDLDGNVEVEPIRSWFVQRSALQLIARYNAAEDGSDVQAVAFVTLLEYFVSEAQPSWEIADHRGVIPATSKGILRLPYAMQMELVSEWLSTLTPEREELPEGLHIVESNAPSAVDAVVANPVLRREIKRRLKKVA